MPAKTAQRILETHGENADCSVTFTFLSEYPNFLILNCKCIRKLENGKTDIYLVYCKLKLGERVRKYHFFPITPWL